MNPLIALALVLVAFAGGALWMNTDTGLLFLNTWASANGGTWHQPRFTCPGCEKRRHIGRDGPTGHTQCITCAPPVREDAR